MIARVIRARWTAIATALTLPHLAVNTLAREFTLTVSQIVEQFKLENCPQQIQKHWQQGELDVAPAEAA